MGDEKGAVLLSSQFVTIQAHRGEGSHRKWPSQSEEYSRARREFPKSDLTRGKAAELEYTDPGEAACVQRLAPLAQGP